MQATRIPGWLHFLLSTLLVLTVTWRILLPAVNDTNFGITSDSNSGGWSSDFAAILTYAKALWAGSAGWDTESHLRVTSERVGHPVGHALPFGYPPTVLLVLGPLCLLTTKWAFVLWTLSGLAAVSWMMRLGSIWTAAAFFSPLSFSCLKTGQTAILTTAGLFALLARDRERTGSVSSSVGDWKAALVLWALSAKPPLALTGAVALLAGGRWRPVVRAVILILLSLLVLTPYLGVAWIRDYLRIVTHYDRESANPIFVWGLVPETMSNLRALLHVTLGLGDQAASRTSSGFWIIALVGTVFAGWRSWMRLEGRWATVVLAYLLFCPHLTSTEDLHLVILVALISGTESVAGLRRLAGIICVMLALFLSPGLLYPTSYRIPLVFGLKVSLLVLVWTIWASSNSSLLVSREKAN